MMENKKNNNFQWKIGYFHIYYRFPRSIQYESAAGVVVSCKIPILATRVRFPGDAQLFIYLFQMWTTTWPELELEPSVDRSEGVKAMVPAWPNG